LSYSLSLCLSSIGWIGLDLFASIRSDSIRSDSIRFDLILFDVILFVLIRFNSIQSAEPDYASLNGARLELGP
jgi:hypothetical protein